MSNNQREIQKLKLLNKISRLINSTQKPDEILNLLLKEAMRILKANSGSILLIEPRTRFLKVDVAQNISRLKIRALNLKVGQGVTGWVAKTGRAMLIKDVSKEPRYVQVDRRVCSELAVPLILEGKVIGVINLDSTRRNAFNKADMDLLSNLATHSAQIIQNARLYAETRKKAQSLSSLFRIGQTLISNIDLEDVLHKVTQEAARLTETKVGSLMLVDEKKEELVIRSVYGASESYSRKPNLPVHQSLLGQVVLKALPLQVLDVKRSSSYRYPEIARKEGLCSLLSVPMIFQDKVSGVLNVYSSTLRHFSQEEVDVLSALSSLAGVAIENARLYGHLIRSEEFLHQQERLAVLGELAAEIAHEIRNPLTAIKMLIQSMQGKEEGSATGIIKKDIEVMSDKIRHMERIVEQVLTMGRPGEISLVPTDIKTCLEETLTFMRFRFAQQRVQLKVDFAKQVPVILLDKGLISQAFLNIILNAMQAMPDGGVLTVSLRMGLNKVYIQFEDTGIGIPDEDLEKLFLPFFTSKEGGTGLGLAIVQRIVESHSGGIYVQSEVGMGSRFTIELPFQVGQIKEVEK